MEPVPAHLWFSTEHLWIDLESDPDHARVGVTDFAQRSLGEVVYIDLPEIGSSVAEGSPFGDIESTKVVQDLHAPASGTVTGRNSALDTAPSLVNEDPYGSGWLITLERNSVQHARLLDADAYLALIEGEA